LGRQEKEYVSGKEYLNLAETKAALLIVDMQRGFVDEGACIECEGAREIVPVINRLVHVARETGAPVVWIQYDATPPIGNLALRKLPAVARGAFWKGSPEGELYPGLVPPVESDIRIVKHTFSAFVQTDLDRVLRNLGVNAVIVTGVATEGCCEATACVGFDLGYLVAFVADATAGVTRAQHEASLVRVDVTYGRVMSATEVEAELLEGAGKVAVSAVAV
jgi:ureidoacrylate peracid hydrolase